MGDVGKNVDLYYMPLSAPCRSVLLLAKSIGLKMTPKLVNVLAGDNRKPEYLRVRLKLRRSVLLYACSYICKTRCMY